MMRRIEMGTNINDGMQVPEERRERFVLYVVNTSRSSLSRRSCSHTRALRLSEGGEPSETGGCPSTGLSVDGVLAC